MPDIVKKYLDKIKEFWNKYNKKQKTIFISSVLVAVIAIAILGFVLATDGCGAVLFNGFRGYGGQTIAHQQ